ncbi:MAG: hydantoinase B/oxoprolinase family protein [Deltaproteobacteria bacterium]|nr:hydantoinase B/oxoprolinase family protein [Deltaproteobacteria bacterium]MBW2151430.1 hydantoinase B/oxoprolinase family protein [Deltaproteobacteria bacterium]
MAHKFDPISLEIMWNRLTSIVDEAAATLLRTSFSTIVKESNDYACVLLDANGSALANNTASIPSFIATVPETVRHFLKRFPHDQWHPQDVVMTNDPWLASGHLPDITMAMPIFYRDRLVAFAGTIAHSPDIGGSVWSADTRELFEEGIRIPIIKLYQAGVPNETLMEIIRENVRIPEKVFGDLNAQITAQTMCSNRLVEFLEETGLEDLSDLAWEIQSRAERVMREAISKVPDGVYEKTVEMDGYEEPIILHCKITVDADELEIDFEGTSAQIDRALNCVMNYTYSYATYPIKCALDPFTPKNEGSYRPITVKAPKGSILNPTIPAPVNARQIIGHMLSACVFGALLKAIPEKVKAESGSQPTLRALFTGTGLDGEKFSSILFANGGMGARFDKDGLSCTPFPTNSSCGSIEVLETTAPLLFWKKEMLADSGGAGKYRGGLGQEIILEVISKDPIRVSLLTDRHHHPAQGYMGGLPGSPNRLILNDGQYIHPKSQTYLNPGDRLVIDYAGGGGFGPPHERDPERIRQDLMDELISRESATTIYGLKERM